MEIAKLLTSTAAKGNTVVSSTNNSQHKPSVTFNEYMSNFLDAANEVRNSRKPQTSFISNENTAVSSKKSFQKFEKEFKSDTDNTDLNMENVLPIVPLNPQEMEAFERIAVLVADGSIDSEALSELSEEDLSEVVEWVLAGASGIFEPYTADDIEINTDELVTENTDVFGLNSNLAALDQLEGVYSKLGEKNFSSSDMAQIAELLDIKGLDSVEIDKLSQAIVELAEKYTADVQNVNASSEEEVDVELNLRDMLKNVPKNELATEIKGVLEEINAKGDLPEIPDTVLKSLCIEVVNVNNKMLDAAELNSKLLDGLNNNQELREQILKNISSPEGSEELIKTVKDEGIGSNNTEIIDNLAAAVLEDNTPEEVAEITLEENDSSSTTNSKVAITDTNLVATSKIEEDVTLENSSVNEESETSKKGEPAPLKETNSDSIKNSNADSLEDKNIKVSVNTISESGSENIDKEQVKDNLKDNLTDRAYSGDNSSSTGEQDFDEETQSEGENSKQGYKGNFDEIVTVKDDSESAIKPDLGENFVESESKVEFKSFLSETPQSPYTSDNPYVKYADMIENLDRLSKLMVNNSDKAMKSVTMELSPPELGKLTIEVSVKDGQANAAIKVETDGAKQMLLNNIEQLKRNLESHGLKLENFEVELNKQNDQNRDQQNAFTQAQQEENQRQSRRRKNRGNLLSTQNDTDKNSVEPEQVRNNKVGSDGSVDIVA